MLGREAEWSGWQWAKGGVGEERLLVNERVVRGKRRAVGEEGRGGKLHWRERRVGSLAGFFILSRPP